MAPRNIKVTFVGPRKYRVLLSWWNSVVVISGGSCPIKRPTSSLYFSLFLLIFLLFLATHALVVLPPVSNLWRVWGETHERGDVVSIRKEHGLGLRGGPKVSGSRLICIPATISQFFVEFFRSLFFQIAHHTGSVNKYLAIELTKLVLADDWINNSSSGWVADELSPEAKCEAIAREDWYRLGAEGKSANFEPIDRTPLTLHCFVPAARVGFIAHGLCSPLIEQIISYLEPISKIY